jgi:MFS family permease
VVGPTLGGVFSTYTGWPWIFFINVPLGLLAAILIVRNFHEKVNRHEHRIDYAGAALLTSSLTLLILGLLEGGQAWAWNSPASLGIFAAGIALFAVFLLVERRAAEPVLPLWAFTRPLLLTTTLLAFCIGAVLIGLTAYIPTYLQITVQADPLIAGLALAALTIGWPISASQAGRIYLRIGFRSTVLIGVAVVIVAAAGLVAIAGTPSIALVAVVCFVMGLGLGLATSPSLVAAQSSAPWNERGVVTGTNLFARSVGSAVGVAVLGAIANGILAGYRGGEDNPEGVIASTTAVFVAALVAAVLAGIAAFAMPKTPLPDADQRSGTIETVAN